MSLTDKIAEKLAGALGWLLLKEIRRGCAAIEALVDEQREARGLLPRFGKVPPAATATNSEDATAEDLPLPEAPPDGDFLRQEILELLAAQQHVPITLDMDLVALGKERGWLNQAGEVVMLPEGFGE